MSVFKPNAKPDIMFLLVSVISLGWLGVLVHLLMRCFHGCTGIAWLQAVSGPGSGSFAFMYLAFRENAYLTPTVRIQVGSGTCSGIHRAISVCAPSDVYRLPPFLCRDASLAGMSVWTLARAGSRWPDRQTCGAGGTCVTRGPARAMMPIWPGHTSRFIPHVW